MGIENNMEKPKENEFEIEKIENPFDKKPIKKDPRVGFNSDTLLDLGDFKVEETLMQELKKAAEEASPAIKDMAEKKIESNEEVGFVALSNKNYEDSVKKKINEREGEEKI